MVAGQLALLLLVFVQLNRGLVGAVNIQARPESLVVNSGENATFICKAQEKLDSCIFRVGTNPPIFLTAPSDEAVRYFGEGLDKGECGIYISRVDDSMNGNITCSLHSASFGTKVHEAQMSLIVAIGPTKPSLQVLDAQDGKYKEKEVLKVQCTVRNGRPIANLSWYLGDEIITEGLQTPYVEYDLKGVGVISQNLTRTLLASDDKKDLKCVSSHHSFRGRNQETSYRIHVNYPPKPAQQPLEFFGLVEGEIGRVPITIEANPAPTVQWSVEGDFINEKGDYGRYSVEPTQEKSPGVYESVLVINTLTKEDTNKKYEVSATNSYGTQHYSVSISTSPEPKVLEMGAGLIIIIVVAILLILLVLAGVFYARAKGKFCFAVGDAEKRVGSPSEGTENPAVNHHASSEYISNSPELKKEKPKEDTPV